MSNKVWMGILGAGAIAAGAAIYYLAQEEEEKLIIFDPKVHTREKLIEILNHFEIEYASIFLHWYSMLKTKEKEVGRGNIPEDVMIGASGQLDKLTESVDEEVFAEHKITKSFFSEWVQKFKNDPEVKAITQSLERNHDKLLKVEQPTFNFQYPKELTKEVYLKYIKVAYGKFRYDTYHEIQNFLRQSGKKQIDDNEFDEIIKK